MYHHPKTLPCKESRQPPRPAQIFGSHGRCEHLTFKEHVDNIVKKVRKLIYTLLLDLKRSGIPLYMLRTFYTACIRPTILYTSPAWFTLTTHTQRLRIERLENLALKIIRPDTEDYVWPGCF